MSPEPVPPPHSADEASGRAAPDLKTTPRAAWRQTLARYERPRRAAAIGQLIDSVGAYALLWVAMYFAVSVSIWLALPLAVLAAGFLVRVFIIFHDCGHGSFLPSTRANRVVGYLTGVLTFTPFRHWRAEHARHHAAAGDLDRRGVGDIWTMTVAEYLAADRWTRLRYRLARNPLVLLLVAPLFIFLLRQRIPAAQADARERRSVHLTNLGIAIVAVGLGWIFGWQHYLILQLTIMATGGAAAVWLFYVQHQFEGVYWERGDNWDFATAALRGSSFYRLPRVLQWFSGNIGFHHLHHLSSRIPNYHLEACHYSDPLFQTVRPVTLRESLRCFAFRLWDENQRRLVGFRHLRQHRS